MMSPTVHTHQLNKNYNTQIIASNRAQLQNKPSQKVTDVKMTIGTANGYVA